MIGTPSYISPELCEGKHLAQCDIYIENQTFFGSLTSISKLIDTKNICENSMINSMAIPVVEFSREGYKIRKVFG